MSAESTEGRLLDLLERWETLKEQGRELSPEDLCADDPECLEPLKRQIAKLRRFEGIAALDSADPRPEFSPRGVGSEVRYEGVKFHAAGGLGAVFTAREAVLGRGVALKFINPARAVGPDGLCRFHREVMITAMLEHPGVVPIYAQGKDADGHPCYAMRFIEGETLADAIERFHAVPVRGRRSFGRTVELRSLLNRFRSACATVAYAHSRGVIHRDIKPANIMLGAFDATMVVDWGLARKIGQDTGGEVEDVEFDETDQADCKPEPEAPWTGPNVGTPGYMSPEQQAGHWEKIDSRCDVYSLGATLYAILTGQSPLSGLPTAEKLRRTANGEIPHPRTITPTVPAALEAICLKAMAWNSDDRYPTAQALSDDLEKWLADEPISVYREPWRYRVRRWMNLHRSLTTAAAASAVIALVGLSVLIAFQTKANRQLAKEIARTRLVNEFVLVDLLGQVAPERNDRARKVTVEELLDPAREAIGTRFDGQPDLMGTGLALIGSIYNRIGQFAKAEPLIKQGLSLYRKHRGEDHPDTLNLLNELSVALAGQGRWEEASAVLRDLIDRQARVKASADPETITARASLGSILEKLGRPGEAEPLLRAAYEDSRRLLGTDHPTTRGAASNLASTLQDLGRLGEAEPLYLESWQAFERGDEHPDVLVGAANHANLLATRGEFERAATLFDRLIESHRRVLGADHPRTADVLSLAAPLLENLGQLERAEAMFRELLQIREQSPSMGRDHPDTLSARRDLGSLLVKKGRQAEGELMIRETLDAQRKKLGNDHAATLATLGALATALQATNRAKEALPLFREALEGWMARGAELPQTIQAHNNLANGLTNAGELEEAQRELRRVVEASRRVLGPEDPLTLTAVNNLAFSLRSAGELSEAADLFRINVEACHKVMGPTHPNTIGGASHLASVLVSLKEFKEADRLIDRTLKECRQAFGPDHELTQRSLMDLAFLRIRERKPCEAVSPAREVVEQRSKELPPGHPDLCSAEVVLGWALSECGQAAEAEPLLRRSLQARRAQLPRGHRLIANSESLLGGCLTSLGRYDEAEPLLLNAYSVLLGSPADRVGGQTGAALDRIIAHYEARKLPDKAKEWRERR